MKFQFTKAQSTSKSLGHHREDWAITVPRLVSLAERFSDDPSAVETVAEAAIVDLGRIKADLSSRVSDDDKVLRRLKYRVSRDAFFSIAYYVLSTDTIESSFANIAQLCLGTNVGDADAQNWAEDRFDKLAGAVCYYAPELAEGFEWKADEFSEFVPTKGSEVRRTTFEDPRRVVLPDDADDDYDDAE